MQYGNPYLANPYLSMYNQGQPVMPQVIQQLAQQQQQPALQQQQAGVRVSGRTEAMNRLLMMYPANMLVPGFISDALFDIDGRHFHALSIEPDGSRNLETFAYQLESTPAQESSEYVSRSEFQELVGKVDQVNQMIGGLNGISQPVQPAASAAATAGQPA